MVATTPIPNRCFIIALACIAILFESSCMVILSGILTSWTIFFVSPFVFSSCWVFYSVNLALLTEAKLLSRPSIASSSKAFDKVSLYSLFEEDLALPKFPFFWSKTSSFDVLNLLVALSSAIFLISSFFGGVLLVNFVLSTNLWVGLLEG